MISYMVQMNMNDDLDDAEHQLLQYLERSGYSLICEPNLAQAARRLSLNPGRFITDVYEGPEGCMTARISEAGRAVLKSRKRACNIS